jgi:hypothetical protein
MVGNPATLIGLFLGRRGVFGRDQIFGIIGICRLSGLSRFDLLIRRLGLRRSIGLHAIPAKITQFGNKGFGHFLAIARFVQGTPEHLNLTRGLGVFVVVDLTRNGDSRLVENLDTPLQVPERTLKILRSLCK